MKKNNINKLDINEIMDYVLPLLKGKERLVVPQFTKMDSWFDGLKKTTPRSLRQK